MTKTIDLSYAVKVSVDETKFTPEFMEYFNRYFHQNDTIEDHLEYIANCYVKGFIIDNFLVGYGDLKKNFNLKIEMDSI